MYNLYVIVNESAQVAFIEINLSVVEMNSSILAPRFSSHLCNQCCKRNIVANPVDIDVYVSPVHTESCRVLSPSALIAKHTNMNALVAILSHLLH